ncbi:ribosomal protein L14, Translation protein SH3-like domain protein [Artemisia annua]|uniref:Ribosomal protein L14, Translation protein SH3-like domain protein n=1 Tax=Artemisia annua TaxID=35608 RepID=A0A2U1Q6K9_ARTAN|nr:ribosomal protein L14, Translation protein SH3-like domain protein [Artemisia annua]
MNFKRLTLTDIKRVPNKKTLVAALEAAEQIGKWLMGKKLIVQKKRASHNDLDRFMIMLAKIKPFKRYAKIGRIALVNYGPDYGELVVIVDVIDQNRRLTLTDIKRVPNKKTLVAALEAADVKNKWEISSWGRKLTVQKKRASLNDSDRFKIMLAKIKLLFYKL